MVRDAKINSKEAAMALAWVRVPCEEWQVLCWVQGMQPCLPAPRQMKQIRSLHAGETLEPFLLDTWERMGKSGDTAHY